MPGSEFVLKLRRPEKENRTGQWARSYRRNTPSVPAMAIAASRSTIASRVFRLTVVIPRMQCAHKAPPTRWPRHHLASCSCLNLNYERGPTITVDPARALS